MKHSDNDRVMVKAKELFRLGIDCDRAKQLVRIKQAEADLLRARGEGLSRQLARETVIAAAGWLAAFFLGLALAVCMLGWL